LVVDDSPTIRKVVESVLRARGFETLTAGDGREALDLLSEHHVDLVLLDFVMPVMNGFQFCRELRANKATERLPVVLMSAKGDKIRGQFVEQTGAIDAITKPFDPRALLAVVENALRKPTSTSPRSEPPPARDDSRLDMAPLEAMVDPTERAREISNLFSKGLARLLLPVLSKLGPNPEPTTLAQTLREVLEPAKLRGLGGLLALLEQPKEQAAALTGDLSFVSIAEVLQMLELQRQFGALTIAYGDQEIILYLAGGKIDLARSAHLPISFRLGRYLVEDGVLTSEQLQALMDPTTGGRRLLGEELVKLGSATAEQIQAALRRQSSELVYESVRWKSGRFTFEAGTSCAEATLAQLGLAPAGLLMEGFRRVDEWQLIEGSFKFDDVLQKDAVALERYDRSKLTAAEQWVLESIDGNRTVRQVVDQVAASTFDTCKILFQFLQARLVRCKTT
jgi:DNA-binding response OmpR family regulator